MSIAPLRAGIGKLGGRLVLASLALLALFGPVATKLFRVEAPPTARHSLVAVAPHQEQALLNDLWIRDAGDRLELTTDFATEYPQFLANATRLELQLATHGGSPTMHSGEIELGSGCHFVATTLGIVTDNSTMTFVRQGACPRPAESRMRGKIRIFASKDAKLALRSSNMDPAYGHGLVKFTEPAHTGTNSHARGSFWPAPAEGTATASRLLARMWRLPHSLLAGWLAACATVLFLALLSRNVAIAAGGVALAVSAAYALVTPPFQAPDEPTHFLTFAQANGREDLQVDARRLADETHFNRIAFRSFEIFSAADAEAPWRSGWQLGAPPEPGSRSRLVTWLWQAIGSAIPGTADAPVALLALRFFNCLAFALAVGLGSLLVVSAATTSTSAIVALCPFFLMPILPYLGMFVSNHAALASGYVLSGLVLTRVLILRRIDAIALVALAATTACLLASGRGAFAALAFWIPAMGLIVVVKAGRASWLHVHATKVAAAAAGLLGAGFLHVLLRPGPPIPSIEAEGTLSVSAAGYAYLVLKELFTMLAPQGRQSWLMDFVWAGFGWLDAIPPSWFVDAGKLVAVAGVVLTMAWSVRRPNPALWFLLGGAACLVAYATALAVGAYLIRHNLHGRYVTGLFTVALPIAFIGWRETETRLRETRPVAANAVVAFLVAACIATHAYMLQSLLGRYFGV